MPPPPPQTRYVFFISDRTGLTVETLGHSLLYQFDTVRFELISLPFIDSEEKALQVVHQINENAEKMEAPPLVFSTLVEPEIRRTVAASNSVFFDFFDTFIDTLEQELGVKSSHTVGFSHDLVDTARYNVRMEAVNFALGSDDGKATRRYSEADLIVIGVSRSGKTPTCLYLALQYGIRSANYPLTDENLKTIKLPPVLEPHRDRIFGLIIDPERLHELRTKRWPKSRYASLKQCRFEVRQVETLYRKEAIPFLNITHMSVEEITASILQATGLPRRSLH